MFYCIFTALVVSMGVFVASQPLQPSFCRVTRVCEGWSLMFQIQAVFRGLMFIVLLWA